MEDIGTTFLSCIYKQGIVHFNVMMCLSGCMVFRLTDRVTATVATTSAPNRRATAEGKPSLSASICTVRGLCFEATLMCLNLQDMDVEQTHSKLPDQMRRSWTRVGLLRVLCFHGRKSSGYGVHISWGDWQRKCSKNLHPGCCLVSC